MIVRTWTGRTRLEDADAYLGYLETTGVAAYRATPGNQHVMVLRRDLEAESEFLVMSVWDNIKSIEKFAGDEPEKAVFYPEDDRFLISRDERVVHYDVIYGS